MLNFFLKQSKSRLRQQRQRWQTALAWGRRRVWVVSPLGVFSKAVTKKWSNESETVNELDTVNESNTVNKTIARAPRCRTFRFPGSSCVLFHQSRTNNFLQ
jgi:hypothetical protein